MRCSCTLVGNFESAAIDLGLGALFFGIAPDRIAVFRDAFGVPAEYTPIGAVAVGHPDRANDPGGSSRTRPRRPIGEIVHEGRFGQRWPDRTV